MIETKPASQFEIISAWASIRSFWALISPRLEALMDQPLFLGLKAEQALTMDPDTLFMATFGRGLN